MLAGRCCAAHFCAEGIFAAAKTSAMSLAAEQAALVHPGAEVGRDGDVGRGGDDAVGQRAAGAARSSRIRPNAAWVDCSSPAGGGDRRDLGDVPKARARFSRAMPAALDQRLDASARHCRRGRPSGSHSSPSAMPIASRRAAIWRRVHQAGMIVLVAGEGQAEALDRVGDEQGRHVVLRRRRTPRPAPPCVAAEIGHQRGQRLVVMRVEDGCGRLAEVLRRAARARPRRPDR